MNDHGYTLAEALTALLMIGLAMGGLTESVNVLAHASTRAEGIRVRAQSFSVGRRAFASLPQDLGPFLVGPGGEPAAWLRGSDREASFACASRTACSVRLIPEGAALRIDVASGDRTRSFVAPGASQARLAYLSAIDGQVSDAWPNGRNKDRLAAIELHADEVVLAELRLPKSQEGACTFDIGMGGCMSALGVARVR